MATDTLYPNTDGTKTGWTGTGSTSNLWDNVNEGTVTPADADYNQASSNVPLFHGLTDTNVNFYQANSVVVRIRVAVTALKGNNRQFSTVQIVQSDESTALTNAVSIASATGTVTTLVANLTVTGATDKTTWDAARLKIGALTGTSGAALIYAIQVEVDYSLAPSGRIHRAAKLDGLGGVGQQRFNPLRSRIWTPPQRAIFVPAFCLSK